MRLRPGTSAMRSSMRRGIAAVVREMRAAAARRSLSGYLGFERQS